MLYITQDVVCTWLTKGSLTWSKVVGSSIPSGRAQCSASWRYFIIARGQLRLKVTRPSEPLIDIKSFILLLLPIWAIRHLFILWCLLAVQDVRVWTLERVAYQQIMKTSAMRRFEERVGFLKSVPLMKDLNEEILSKIADVLKEVMVNVRA